MERTKELQLLQTVVGVITLNINGREKAFTVFYGGAMYPWIDNKMLVMPEGKYKEMLKEFFLNEGKEFIVPTPQKIAQDRAEVINNYRAGMYENPDSYQYIEKMAKERPQVEQVEEPVNEPTNEPIKESQPEEPYEEEEYTEETVGGQPEEAEAENESYEEPQLQEYVDESHENVEETTDNSEKNEPVAEEQHEEEIYFDTEALTEEPSKPEITSGTIDIIRSRHLIDEKAMLKDGLVFVNEIDDVGSLFSKPTADAIDDLIISATDDELAEMARFLVRKYNLEDKLSEEAAQETTEQILSDSEDSSVEKAEGIVRETEAIDTSMEEQTETEMIDTEQSFGEEEKAEACEASESEAEPIEKVEDLSEYELEEEQAPEQEPVREIIYKADDSKIEELFGEIKRIQKELQNVKQVDTSSELSAIDDKLNYLISENKKPDGNLENLSTELQELISMNKDIDLSQVSALVDEQSQMVAEQRNAIKELTQTVENQKEIIDKFKNKIDQTQKMEKTRVKKTWAIMILGVIIMVGITVCTQLFLPKAESAIKLDSNTDAEVHIVVHNDDGTDSFERIGSIIIRDGKLEIGE